MDASDDSRNQPAVSVEERNVRDPASPPERVDFYPVLFYVFAFAIAWTAWAPLLAHVRQVVTLPVPFPVALFVCQTLGAFAPLLSLCVIQRVRRQPDLAERVLKKIRFRNVPVRWFVLPAVTPVLIAIVTAVCTSLTSAGAPVPILNPDRVEELGWGLLAVIPITFFVAMIGSPFGEEPGWRGYLLDGFLAKSQGLRGSAIVATLWWVWHVPLFLVLGVTPSFPSFLEMVGHSLLIDTFFILSGRNLLCAMLYHQGVSINFMFFNPQTKSLLGLTILLVLAVAARWHAHRKIPIGVPRAADSCRETRSVLGNRS